MTKKQEKLDKIMDKSKKYVGIDIGSRYVKIVTYDDSDLTFNRISLNTIDFYKKYTYHKNNKLNIDLNNLLGQDIFHITATGYGRNLLEFNNAEIISEIKAHFRGARRSSKMDDFTLIDIGGQDSKVIISRNGYIEDFIMNDKCAASTGRFLENSASILGITVEELASMKDSSIDISVTCAVFAESEIISQLASGKRVEQIGAGINLSIAKRIATLLSSKLSDNVLASGGVSKSKAIIEFMSEIIKKDIIIIENSEFNGAFGALKEYQA